MKSLIEILDAHIRYRRQILKMAKADLVKTYKGAALGWVWAFLQPAIMIGVYYFALSVGLRKGTHYHEYSSFVWLLAGVVPWFYMRDMWPGGASSIKRYGYLVTKIKFPVATIPTFCSISKLIVHIALMVLVMIIYVVEGHMPDIYWLQIPLYTLLMFIFFTTWSLFAGLLSVVSRDFMHLVKSSTMALFWVSGIIYNVRSIGDRLICKVMLFNPLTVVADGYRNSLIYKEWFWEHWVEMRNFAIVYGVLFCLTLFVYKRLIKIVPDLL